MLSGRDSGYHGGSFFLWCSFQPFVSSRALDTHCEENNTQYGVGGERRRWAVPVGAPSAYSLLTFFASCADSCYILYNIHRGGSLR